VIPDWKKMQGKNKANARILFNKNEKIEELITYVPWQTMENLPPLKWNLALSSNTAIAFEPSRILLQILGIGTVAITLLEGAIATIIAHRLTLPIRIAATAVIKLGQRDLDTRIPIKGKDEFATLASSINQMAQQLQDLLDQQIALKDLTVHFIEGIVTNIQFETTEVIKAIELRTAQVAQGTHLVGHTKQSLNEKESEDRIQNSEYPMPEVRGLRKERIFLLHD
jgi:methyl-accepting chemotaxis protein PixJ